MKKNLLIFSILISQIVFCQNRENGTSMFYIDGFTGKSALFNDLDKNTNGLGLGMRSKLFFGMLDFSFDFSKSESRDYEELKLCYDYPINISFLSDSINEFDFNFGAGLGLGRILNSEYYFWDGVDYYSTRGLIFNLGLEYIRKGLPVTLFFGSSFGSYRVLGWEDSSQSLFKLSLGCRFILDYY
jgi:hypothetical protein